MLRLVNTVQAYPWGSTTVIPELLGTIPTGAPAAELWLGAHRSAPSRTTQGSGLDEVIARDPASTLGDDVARRFGGRLPYLLKVLAADRPLSMQVHPGLAQARAGFAAEEAAAVPMSAPYRNYKDDNHKPEAMVALTPFEALCGFRSVAAAQALVAGLDAPLARELAAILAVRPGEEAIATAMRRLLDPTDGPSAQDVDRVVRACAGRPPADSPDPAADRVVVRLAEAYPGDPGVVTSLLLNHVTLEPGEAVYLPSGVVHAYLRGAGLEVMASSDNVLRAGLTTKHVDAAEALATIDFTAFAPTRVVPEVIGATRTFRTSAAEFTLSLTTVAEDAVQPLPGSGPRIVLCLTGEVTVRTASGDEEILPRGSSVFVPASDGAADVRGAGTVVQADVP